tara:strand:- start:1256 stop:1594 length:339 start_codon:yes stop_codon:yes gene_type:complete
MSNYVRYEEEDPHSNQPIVYWIEGGFPPEGSYELKSRPQDGANHFRLHKVTSRERWGRRLAVGLMTLAAYFIDPLSKPVNNPEKIDKVNKKTEISQKDKSTKPVLEEFFVKN